ncbi:OsmC family peroxiredoxin [Flavobacteriaceae bacterium Ap0902]|nr:OsmC family peroxiredoxin [Flavobacteriaceae bacterium Ap0902]
MGYKVKVTGNIGTEKYYTKLSTEDNIIMSDEPIKFGGQNKGFNPFELLASSLAACTLATLKAYIDMKGWDIPEVEVEVEFESFPKEKQSIFKRYIDFKGANLTEKEKNRLFQIAEKCPVHNLLLNKIEIFSELKSDIL